MPDQFVSKDHFDRHADSIDRWRAEVKNRLDEHHHALFGNGKPGMDEMLRKITEWVEDQKSKEKERWSDWKKFIVGAAAFILNTMLAFWLSKLFGG
jgi:hypothetical protein